MKSVRIRHRNHRDLAKTLKFPIACIRPSLRLLNDPLFLGRALCLYVEDCQLPFPVLTILQDMVPQMQSAQESPGNCVCAGLLRLGTCGLQAR